MTDKPRTTTVGATVTPDLKDRIKSVAEFKHWSVGMTLRLFIDRYWDDWEKELGMTPPTTETKVKTEN